jgi:transposase
VYFRVAQPKTLPKMDFYIKPLEWEQIIAILRLRKDIKTGNEGKLRLFIEAIWYMARSGCQWRLLPAIYGSWRAAHMRFKHWSDKGVWAELFERLKVAPDMEVAMIDSTIVRAHACSAGYKKDSQEQEALGRSRGGFTTKIHALVDALGNPLKFTLTAGQRHDITQAESLVQGIGNAMLVADKGYDSIALIEKIQEQKCIAVIPPKKNRKYQREYDLHVYRERHLIECFFGKIKHFRRVFSRFDKTAASFMSFLHFVGALIWLR